MVLLEVFIMCKLTYPYKVGNLFLFDIVVIKLNLTLVVEDIAYFVFSVADLSSVA